MNTDRMSLAIRTEAKAGCKRCVPCDVDQNKGVLSYILRCVVILCRLFVRFCYICHFTQSLLGLKR